MAGIRTFVAIDASGGVRSKAAALIARFRQIDAKVRWVNPENMHWTVKFLGNVDDRLTPEVCRRATEVVAEMPMFDIKVEKVGAFPNLHRPRTVWLGVSQGEEEMAQIHDALDATLAEIGIASEGRRYKPHLTIGRVRGPRNLEALGRSIADVAESYDGGVTEVDELVVYSSHLQRGGPQHQPLGYCPLQGMA